MSSCVCRVFLEGSLLALFVEESKNVCIISDEQWSLEVIGGVSDPVGCLIFGALGGAVGGEQGFEGL